MGLVERGQAPPPQRQAPDARREAEGRQGVAEKDRHAGVPTTEAERYAVAVKFQRSLSLAVAPPSRTPLQSPEKQTQKAPALQLDLKRISRLNHQ
jgi:hypothetical protein